MDYAGAVASIAQAQRFGIEPSLDGIRALTEALGRPQDAFACVQVTGTNGKSSVTRLIEAILVAEGVAAGAYTSPHLESYTERIELGGAPCSEDDFALAVAAALGAARTISPAREVTEFELLTAAALWLFRERAVDVACLEVGMGGRWDATSVVDPAVAVITGVGLDHTDRLGTTVEEIASDKAHIIKRAASVILGPGTEGTAGIFLDRASALGLHPRFVASEGSPSPLAEARTVRFAVEETPTSPGGRLTLRVRGAHATYQRLSLGAPAYQAANVATAIAAAEAALGRPLRVERLRSGLAGMTFPGRFELASDDPLLVLDGAHNPQAAAVLAGAVAQAWPDTALRPVVVLGVLADKDAAGIVAALAPVARAFVVAQPDAARALPAAELGDIVAEVTGTAPLIVPDVAHALAAAQAMSDAAGVLVTGSLYTVGQARTALRRSPPASR